MRLHQTRPCLQIFRRSRYIELSQGDRYIPSHTQDGDQDDQQVGRINFVKNSLPAQSLLLEPVAHSPDGLDVATIRAQFFS